MDESRYIKIINESGYWTKTDQHFRMLYLFVRTDYTCRKL